MENEINYFVTNRDFEKISFLLKITPKFIEELPIEAKVLEIGSGVTQNFARGLSEKRKDLKIVSLDPTISLNSSDFTPRVIRGENNELKSIYYTNNPQDVNGDYYLMGKYEPINKLHEERISEAQKSGFVVSALAPELPFKENTFDLIIDSFGPILYLPELGHEKMASYLTRIYDVLKPGGEFRAYPVKIDYLKKILNDLNLKFDIEINSIDEKNLNPRIKSKDVFIKLTKR